MDPTSLSDAPAGHSRFRWRAPLWSSIALGLLVAAVAYVGAALYTDQPRFCVSCHEMRPYYDAWSSGPHKDQWCVDCHVDPGYAARLGHKFAVLREVAVHFGGKPEFPLAKPSAVPNARCSACHTKIAEKFPRGFSHQKHVSKGTCQSCHPSDGHGVSRAALGLEGVLNPVVVAASRSTSSAVAGGGSANLTGHVAVMCVRCHDLKLTGCAKCHAAPVKAHPAGRDCAKCHGAGPKWLFTHPRTVEDCRPCHALPKKHFRPASASLEPCSACHKRPGTSWGFRHPGSSADCQSCHARPAKHSAGQCSTCHRKAGVSFAFRHPPTNAEHSISGIACAKCHPRGYTTASCTCHGGGTSVADD